MVRKANVPKLVIAAALALAREKKWRHISLHEIAARASVPLADLYEHFWSKEAILTAFTKRIDMEVLEGLDPEDVKESPRDQLFDVLMRRFDALAPDKESVAAVLRDVHCDPLALAGGLCRYLHSMAWMLEAAGISSSGLRGHLRVKGLAAIYLAVLKVWIEDESADMAKTMAALDTWLGRAEWLEARADSCFRIPQKAPEAPEEALGEEGAPAGG